MDNIHCILTPLRQDFHLQYFTDPVSSVGILENWKTCWIFQPALANGIICGLEIAWMHTWFTQLHVHNYGKQESNTATRKPPVAWQRSSPVLTNERIRRCLLWHFPPRDKMIKCENKNPYITRLGLASSPICRIAKTEWEHTKFKMTESQIKWNTLKHPLLITTPWSAETTFLQRDPRRLAA